MKSFFPLLCGSFIPLIGLSQTSQDKKAVEAVVHLFQQDFNDGRFKNAPTYTTADWQHINPNGGITRGRSAVLKEVKGVHQTFLKGITMRIERMSTRFVKPEVAVKYRS